MTLRSFVIRGLAFVAATLLLVSGMAAPVLAADIDENIPPSLVTIHRSSPETVRHGDEIRIDWVVQGSPAGNVIFYLRDRLGNQVQARWDAPSGTSAFAGTATATIDVMRVAAGDLALSSFGAGNGYANSNYGSDGSVGKSPEGVQEPIQASFDYAQVSSRVESSRDISIPPSLVSMNRTSPDVIRDGDQLMIDWEVKNSPATNVIFYLRDRLGSQVQVRWDAPNGTDAFAGTATATIDDTRVAAGDLVLSSFGVGNGYANSSYGTDGSIGKSPEGAQDPLHVAFDYAQISSRVESSRDVSVPPSLVNAKRTSPDMLRVGDQIMIDWEVRNSPATNVIFYLRDSLGNQLQARWDTPNAEAAFSGTATASIDAGVAEGDLVLTSFGAGNGYANSNYGVDGSVGSSPEGAQDPIPTVFDYAQVTSSVVSVSDVSVPPSLVSFQRTSSDVVRAGDEITIDWAVQDRPVSYIGFYLRDSLGHTQNVRWDGPEAFSGTARYVVDDTQLAAGDLELVTVSMVSTNSKMTYSSDGTVNRNPSGLKAPKPSLLNFADAGVELVSERDISVPPSLVSFQRTSSDVVRAGDEITIDWAVQDRPVSYIGFYLRDSLGHTQNVRWDGPEAFSGTARYLVDDTQLAAGDLELVTVSMVSTNSKMTYSSDGTVNRNPSGLKAPKPSLLNFADAGVELVSERDISVPPSLVSFQRTSSDVVRAGDEITIDWAVQDRPVSYIGFYLRDSLGHTQNVRWDGPEAFSGTARYLVDDTQLAAGDLDLVTVSMISTNSKMTYSSDGTVNRNPSGLEAPKPSVLNFADAGVHLSPPAPYEVVVIAPGFIDEDGTTADTYTIPAMAGVEYLAGDEVVEAGTYPGAGSVTVTARATTDYAFKAGAVTEWKFSFKATPYEVTPAAAVFTDKDGTAEDSYTIPTTGGVEYLVGDHVVEAGTYPGAGSVTVTARATTDYAFKAGAVTEWKFSFKATPYEVTPAGVVFTDKDGTAEDSYTIPTTGGVEYLVGDHVVEAGTYPGAGSVTVTARATTDYAFKAGAVTEWNFSFKATPYEVVPAAVVFTEMDGTAEDTYSVPTADGVEYLVGEKVVEAGTYPGTGTVTVTAQAKTDYVFKAGAVTDWTATFKATPYEVVPAVVVFTDKDGTAEDTYTVPAVEGVEYLVGEKVVEAGTYPGTGSVIVTAKAKTDYVFKAGAVTEWTFSFKATPYEVVPGTVVFTDKDGTAEDTYTVPTSDGVEYVVSGKVVEAGTYPGTGSVTVTARAKTDYLFKAGAAAEWTATFKATPYEVVPGAVGFTDKDGTAEDTYTVPATEGVEYLLGEKVVQAGSFPGAGTVKVSARAKTDYVLKAGAAAEWTATFKATPYEVVPAAVVFVDKDGTAQDTYTVPFIDGVDYLIAGKTIAAGTYSGTGTVSVVAKAKPDYVLKAGSVTSWATTFKAVFRMTMVVAAGDLNSDGRADVLARDGGGTLWLYPSNGRGGWLARIKAGGGWNIMNSLVGAGDLNGDRKADVLARDTAGTLWLYPGNGHGGWQSRVRAGNGWHGMTSIVGPGDLNGDGKSDLLARDSSGTLWLYPGNGRGGWLTRVRAGGGWNVMTAVVGPGDMNGDRKADVLARDSSGTLWLYPGNGRGGWLNRLRAGSGWNAMSTITGRGDFNGDGRNDVLAVDAAGVLWLYKGSGTGSWLGRTSAGTGWN